jgi:L-fuculose-phosphate aldolase
MIEDFKRFGRLLFQERLIDSHGGNMSVFDGEKILITRRNAMLGDLRDNDIVEVGLERGENDNIASRELEAHRALYKKKAVRAIIHAHPAAAIAVSITDNRVVPQDAEGIFLYKAAPIVRARDGVGSEETVRLLPSFLGNDNVVAMVKGHGSFAVGNTLEEAYKYTSALENSCKIIVAVRSMAGRGERKGGAGGGRGRQEKGEYKSAIPPGIGVMDRSRYRKR